MTDLATKFATVWAFHIEKANYMDYTTEKLHASVHDKIRLKDYQAMIVSTREVVRATQTRLTQSTAKDALFSVLLRGNGVIVAWWWGRGI